MDYQPVSILDRDGPRPIIIEADNSADMILPIILLIVFVIFLIWMLVLLIISGFKTTSTSDPVSSDNRLNDPTIGTCPSGQCATNLISGFKVCPIDDGDSISYNPTQEVCNDRFFCNNPLTPFAVQSNGSTDINGTCEEGVECNCLRHSQCPEYILSAFTTRNGNPYVSFNGQRITFPQFSSYVDSNGETINTPPLQYDDPSTTFCTAPLSWLPFSNPGCNFVGIDTANNMTYDEVLLCMGLVNGCSGTVGTPCLNGVLAFITNNPESLNQGNMATTQMGCVRGEACPCGLATIYDTNYGGIICRELPESLTIVTDSLPDGDKDVDYNAKIIASGGITPYRFIANGLPSGLSMLNSTENIGFIVGRPTESGLFSINIIVKDNIGNVMIKTLQLTIKF